MSKTRSVGVILLQAVTMALWGWALWAGGSLAGTYSLAAMTTLLLFSVLFDRGVSALSRLIAPRRDRMAPNHFRQLRLALCSLTLALLLMLAAEVATLFDRVNVGLYWLALASAATSAGVIIFLAAVSTAFVFPRLRVRQYSADGGSITAGDGKQLSPLYAFFELEVPRSFFQQPLVWSLSLVTTERVVLKNRYFSDQARHQARDRLSLGHQVPMLEMAFVTHQVDERYDTFSEVRLVETWLELLLAEDGLDVDLDWWRQFFEQNLTGKNVIDVEVSELEAHLDLVAARLRAGQWSDEQQAAASALRALAARAQGAALHAVDGGFVSALREGRHEPERVVLHPSREDGLDVSRYMSVETWKNE